MVWGDPQATFFKPYRPVKLHCRHDLDGIHPGRISTNWSEMVDTLYALRSTFTQSVSDSIL